MLKLNASYSKKVPVPDQEYSSQSYHAAVECELSDGLSANEIQERIHNVFETVRQSVENELTGKHPVQQEVVTLPPQQVQPRQKSTGSTNDNGKATTRQIKFITDLAGRRGLTLDKLDDTVERLFQVHGIYELNRKQASKLVDQLKAA